MSEQTHTSSDQQDGRTTRPALVVRSIRVHPIAWRAAATRAKRDGRGLAEIVGALVAAYGAGDIDAPATTGQAATRARFPQSSDLPTTHHHDHAATTEGSR